MNVTETALPGVLIIEPDVFKDARGLFLESWNRMRYSEAGINFDFVQDNLSWSHRGVLRGLHFQNPQPQGKLVYVVQGEVFDVSVDVRVGSPNFGQWIGILISSENRKQVYIPEGFAHGFCVTSPMAMLAYKCTSFYNPEAEGGVLWKDPDIGITWPVQQPTLSAKDHLYGRLKDINKDSLPQYGGRING